MYFIDTITANDLFFMDLERSHEACLQLCNIVYAITEICGMTVLYHEPGHTYYTISIEHFRLGMALSALEKYIVHQVIEYENEQALLTLDFRSMIDDGVLDMVEDYTINPIEICFVVQKNKNA